MKRLIAALCCGAVMAASYGCQKTEERTERPHAVVDDVELPSVVQYEQPEAMDPVLAAIGHAVDDFTTQKETQK